MKLVSNSWVPGFRHPCPGKKNSAAAAGICFLPKNPENKGPALRLPDPPLPDLPDGSFFSHNSGTENAYNKSELTEQMQRRISYGKAFTNR
jgi:hypothetical protein